MGARFEIVSKYADKGINLPCRKTKHSAGYDFEAAEDIIISPFEKMFYCDKSTDFIKKTSRLTTLVPTGIKCKLDPGTYLELSVRSSTPLKTGLMLANGVGRL